MEPVYHSGDYVYYEDTSTADPGEDVIVDTDDGAVSEIITGLAVDKSVMEGVSRMDRIYICCDMKSFYASIECVYRSLDPLKANLLVADASRSDQTICLAVSPALKAKGVPSRPRLFEAKQAIQRWEAANRQKLSYLIATPRMAEYERVSAQIYSIFLRYATPDDIHVYSIDVRPDRAIMKAR